MTELKKLLIETPVDELVELVVRKKKISLKDAAKTLKVGEEIIEEWVGILEAHGYLKLSYMAMGSPVIEIGDAKVPQKDSDSMEEPVENIESQISETKKELESAGEGHEKIAARKKLKILSSLLKHHKKQKTKALKKAASKNKHKPKKISKKKSKRHR